MDFLKRLTGVLLAVLMVFVYMPSFAFAEGEDADTGDQIKTEESDKVKEDVESTEAPESAGEPENADQPEGTHEADAADDEEGAEKTASEKGTLDSGSCGAKLTWTLSTDYVLTIKGTGAMYNYNSDEGSYTPWYDYSGDIESAVVGSGVTTIGSDAFFDCNYMESISLPSTLKSIGNWAFYQCYYLENVTIPSSVTSIGVQAFYDCESLTSITIPSGVTSIEIATFDGCSGLSRISIPNTVTYIDESAFYGCTSLTSVTIPSKVTSIEYGTFYDCTSLTSVTIPNGVEYIGDYAFAHCNSLESIDLPSNLNYIGECAFTNCYGLTSISIPDGVTDIEYGAFSNCTGLTSIYITDSVTYIDDNAFNSLSDDCIIYATYGSYAAEYFEDDGYTVVYQSEITQQPEDLTVVEGETAIFTVEAAGEGLEYQWQWKSGSKAWANTTLSGYNTDTLSFTAQTAHSGRQYRCVITDENGSVTVSRGATLTVENGPVIASHPANVKAAAGSKVVFRVEAKGIGLKYQWQWKSGSKAWANTTLSGYDTDTLSFIAQTAHNGRQYRCVVTDASGDSVASNGATLTIKAGPAISAHPEDVEAAVGEKAIFRVTASGNGIKYQWQWKSGTRAWANTTLTGYNTNTLSFITQEAHDGRQYRCVVTDANGNVSESEAATLIVVPGPGIVSQPEDVTAAVGEKVVFKVNASGTGLKYQWQWKSGTRAWANTTLTGYNTNTLTFTAQDAHNGRQYRCVVTDKDGYTNETRGASLTIKPGPAITIQPESVSVVEGQTATFKVKASGSGLKYQWQWKSGTRAWANTTLSGYNTNTLTFTVTEAHNGRQYRCVVTDANGYSNESKGATLTVNPSPYISGQPANVSTYDGETATFKVTAAGSGLKYQWQWKSGSKAWANTSLSGYNTNTLSFTAQTSFSGRQYRCIVTDSNGRTAESGSATLTIKPSPVISGQPKDLTVSTGEKATFKVTASGNGISYQWQWKSGSRDWADTTMSGYNTDTLSFTAQAAHNGRQYRCVVTDKKGVELASDAATLTVQTVKYRALCVGNNYMNSSSELNGCINDANAISGMLKTLKVPYTVTTKTEASASTILNSITTAASGSTDSDVFLFSYSGHGVYDFDSYGNPTDYTGALCGYNSSTGSIDYVLLSELAEKLSKVNGKVIVILDSCHSGAAVGKDGKLRSVSKSQIDAFNEAVISAFSGYTMPDPRAAENSKFADLCTSKFIVLTAASYTESSLDIYDYQDGYYKGNFTAALINGVGATYPNGAYSGSMPADSNADNTATLGEMYEYIYSQISDAHKCQYYGTYSYPMFVR